MRCHICDVLLSPNEVKFNESTHSFEPCSQCIEEAEGAYRTDFEKDTFTLLDEEDLEVILAEGEK